MIVVSLILVLLSLALLVFGLVDASQTLIWASVIASLVAGILLIVSVIQTSRATKRESEFAEDELDDDQLSDRFSGYGIDDEDPAHTVVFDPLSGANHREGGRRRRAAEPAEPEPAMWQATQTTTDWEATQAVSDADLADFRQGGSNYRQAAVADEPNPELESTATWKPEWSAAAAGGAAAMGSNLAQESSVVADEGASEYYEDPPDEPAEEIVSDVDARQIAEIDDEVLVVDGRPRYHITDCGHLRNRETIPLYLSEAREAGFTPCGLCRPDRSIVARQRNARR